MRNTEEPIRDDRGDEYHPSFAVVNTVRSQGTGRTLFQSDLKHNETIVLTISRASRKRDLNRDWVHSHQELIEVEMSLAQWGALVSSTGIGSGVPVTLRRTENEVFVPGLPDGSRIQHNLKEVDQATDKLLEQIRERFTVLKDAIESKKGLRITRQALHDLEVTLANANANTKFSVTSLREAAESLVHQAKADIEAHVLATVNQVGGTASIQTQSLDLGELPSLPAGQENDEDSGSSSE